MHYNRHLIILFFAVVLVMTACKPEPKRSFYYWKTIYNLSPSEEKLFEEINISKLYIRFFDVDIDKSSGTAVPVARIRFSEEVIPGTQVVPVVYITNKIIQRTKVEDIEALSLRILNEVDKIASDNNIIYSEIQIDCDWAENTQRRYFEMLKVVRENLKERGIIVSATIRLHQVKYRKTTGVPPVDRGMLMYYNMGKISPGISTNSVFNTSDAARYIDYLPDYPLPLDIALPAFSWGIHIRNGKVIGLLNNMNLSVFDNNASFKRLEASSFSASESFFFKGFYFMKDDIVKVEEIAPEQCLEAAHQVKNKLPGSPGSVAIFHLDSVIFSNYDNKGFEKVFGIFH